MVLSCEMKDYGNGSYAFVCKQYPAGTGETRRVEDMSSNSQSSGAKPSRGINQFASSTYWQPQNNINASSCYQPISQMHSAVAPAGGQPFYQHSSFTTVSATDVQPNPSIQLSSDWQEHMSSAGIRYYYNKKARKSSWEKPVELMTPTERADASTDWKEFTNPAGRKYYYNKVTNLSRWTIPEELKLAREQVEREASHGIQSEGAAVSQPQVSLTVPLPKASSVPSSASSGTTTSPVPVTVPNVAIKSHPSGVPAATTSATNTSDIRSSLDGGAFVQDLEEARKGMAKINLTPSEEKAVEEETLIHANKKEGEIESKAISELESDWNWELV